MCKGLIAILLMAFYCGSVFAGDEVDYSAPYITLEDGELVTKYPAKEHDPNAPQPETVTENAADPGAPGPLSIFLVAALIALAVFLSRNDKRQRHDPDEDSAA